MSVTLFIIILLMLGVILVNGWTDAPNAIATVVSTRAMTPKASIVMASIFNFIGLFVMTYINSKVAFTIGKMADFGSGKEALIALEAAMVAIIVFAIAAWVFGIPTSESHALIAGVTGAAISIGGFSSVNAEAWNKVLDGLLISSVIGFGLGYFLSKLVNYLFRNSDRFKVKGFFTGGQIVTGAAMAFLHGAQDGQKFLGIFMLSIYLEKGEVLPEAFSIDIWVVALCAIVMGIGTSIGGYRIIKAVGMDMVKLEMHQGFTAGLAASICLLFSSLSGIPVSTTHTKTTAIMGVGAEKNFHSVNWKVVQEMVLAWVLTFPVCGLIGYFMSKLFAYIF
ncbi:MAG: inorganic phosphate transporter PiT [Bacillales bacterium]|jgi:PiT family inorganic phosphate transporter|nr:inorganic phosphate transporter PiT [Bacillales bacterium]